MKKDIKIVEYKIINKPWGYEKIIVHNSKYALKEIFMNKGTRSSLQSHNNKLETIYIIKGRIELEVLEKSSSFKEIYYENESYSIIPKIKHRVTVLEDCVLFEVSTPELEDVIRYEDDFKRKTI